MPRLFRPYHVTLNDTLAYPGFTITEQGHFQLMGAGISLIPAGSPVVALTGLHQPPEAGYLCLLLHLPSMRYALARQSEIAPYAQQRKPRPRCQSPNHPRRACTGPLRTCSECRVCFCSTEGADDDQPHLCDTCWAKHNR